MSNTAVTLAAVIFMVLASTTASFARGGGLGRPNAAIGTAMSTVTDPSGIGNANKVAPLPPPHISVPTVPQFK